MKAESGRRRSQRSRGCLAALLAVGALLGTSCNAAIGGGAVAALGGVGILAGQCYDRVRVKVRDPHTGLTTCDADVYVSDADGSERRLRPCYNAALTEGTWKLTARHDGYAPAVTELTIPDHDGDCPHYTHTVELTLRREGEPSTPPMASRSATPADSAPPATDNPLDTPPSRIVPPPIPGVTPAPPAPTAPARTFDPATPPAPSPTPAPAPATPPAAPSPTPGPAPAPSPPPSN